MSSHWFHRFPSSVCTHSYNRTHTQNTNTQSRKAIGTFHIFKIHKQTEQYVQIHAAMTTARSNWLGLYLCNKYEAITVFDFGIIFVFNVYVNVVPGGFSFFFVEKTNTSKKKLWINFPTLIITQTFDFALGKYILIYNRTNMYAYRICLPMPCAVRRSLPFELIEPNCV